MQKRYRKSRPFRDHLSHHVVALALPGAIIAASLVLAQPAFAGSLEAFGVAVKPLTLLQILHLAGLVLGGGATVLVDGMLLRHLYHQPVDDHLCLMIERASPVVVAGFGLLWLTGIGFILQYLDATPEKLVNPKMWAKVAIVCLMTINAVLIHEFALPAVRARRGKPLLAGLSLVQALPVLAMATLSATGWMTAFLLGKLREFNGVISGSALLNAFGTFFAVALGLVAIIHLTCAKTRQKANGHTTQDNPPAHDNSAAHASA